MAEELQRSTTFTASRPPGRSARRASAANSTVVRRRGAPQVVKGVEDHDVREPVPPAQPALQEPAPVEGADPQLPRGAQAEVLARQPDERGVDLRGASWRDPGRVSAT